MRRGAAIAATVVVAAVVVAIIVSAVGGGSSGYRVEAIFDNAGFAVPGEQVRIAGAPVGTIATWTQQADSSTAVVNTLSYDHADQLTGCVQSGGATAGNKYNYDPAGNRLAETTEGSFAVGPAEEIIAFSSPSAA